VKEVPFEPILFAWEEVCKCSWEVCELHCVWVTEIVLLGVSITEQPACLWDYWIFTEDKDCETGFERCWLLPCYCHAAFFPDEAMPLTSRLNNLVDRHRQLLS
jgi:hypothetical protein